MALWLRLFDFELEAHFTFERTDLKVLLWQANDETKPNPVDLFNAMKLSRQASFLA